MLRHLASIPKVVLPILLVTACLLWFMKFYFIGFRIGPLSDVWDLAQQSRELALGHGFVSKWVHPINLFWISDHAFPNLWRPPFYNIVISGIFWLFGSMSIMVLFLTSGAFFILGAFPLYCFSRRLFDKETALLSAGIYLFSSQLWGFSFEGVEESFFITLSLFIASLLAKYRNSNKFLWGTLIGLLALSRYATYLFLPIVGILVWRTSRKSQAIPLLELTKLLGGFLLINMPWYIRNYIVAGNPFFNMNFLHLASFSPEYPGWSLFRHVENFSIQEYLISHSSDILLKFCDGINYYVVHMIEFLNPAVLILLIISPWVLKGEGHSLNYFKYLITTILFIIILLAPLKHQTIMLFPTLPFVFPLVSHTFMVLRKRSLVRNKYIRAFLYLTAGSTFFFPTFRFVMQPRTDSTDRYLPKEIVAEIKREVPDQGIIPTDIPDMLAWKGDVRTVWLPSLEDLRKMDPFRLQIEAIYLSSNLLNFVMADDPEDPWIEIYKTGGAIEGYRLAKRFNNGSLFYMKK